MCKRIITFIFIIFAVTQSAFGAQAGADPTIGKCFEVYDPYEKLNRKIFAINKTLDQTLLRPATLLYINTVPQWPRARVSSFFANLASPLTFINNIFQGDFDAASKTFGRFLFNSTAGLGGLLDWAQACGVEDNPQLFEDSLMKFGVPYGQYIMIPILGPSTTRGTAGKVVDTFTDPVNLILMSRHNNSALTYFLAKKFDQRAQSEEDLDLSKQNLLDEYSFIRSSYIQYIASTNPFCKNKQEIDYDLYN
jgi:phospholipid-binding lipoprotein MlaA